MQLSKTGTEIPDWLVSAHRESCTYNLRRISRLTEDCLHIGGTGGTVQTGSTNEARSRFKALNVEMR